MSRPADPIRNYLEYLKAGDKSGTIAEQADRLIHLSALRGLLGSLRAEGFSIEEGLIDLADEPPEAAHARPDFMIYRDDVLLYLYFVPLVEVNRVPAAQMHSASEVLRKNAALTGIVFIWPETNYPACALDAFLIRKLQERTGTVVDLSTESIQPVVDAIRAFYNGQFVDWKLAPPEPAEGPSPSAPFSLSDLLKHELERQFQDLTDTAFKIPEKRQAKASLLTADQHAILQELIQLLSKPALEHEDVQRFERFVRLLAES